MKALYVNEDGKYFNFTLWYGESRAYGLKIYGMGFSLKLVFQPWWA
jgi:hypothetical protein